jgi:group I intron endonuclease
MASGVYIIRCFSNDKFYVGSAVDLEDRFKRHKRMLMGNYHHNKHLQNAWNKYGEEVFAFEILEEVPNFLEQEQYWIDKLEACLLGFNILPTAGSTLGHQHSEETKRLISEKNKERNLVGENNPFYGQMHTEEKKVHWSKARKGQQAGEANPFYGRHHTDESKEKRRQTFKDRGISYLGEKNPAAKLTWTTVGELRELYSSGSYTYKDLATKYGISVDLVGKVIREEKWVK